MNILTWNLGNQKKLKSRRVPSFYRDFADFLRQNQVDIVVLQECFGTDVQHLQEYSEVEPHITVGQRGLRILCHKASAIQYDFPVLSLNNKILGVRLQVLSGYTFNLIGVHLYSKVGRSTREHHNLNCRAPAIIQEFEALTNSDRTLVVGDMNYLPYDEDMLDPAMFNAIKSREIIRLLNQRLYHGQSIPYFYNPMWNMLGDQDSYRNVEKVEGTYYWNSEDAVHTHWNLFDGVLIRPSLMDSLEINTMRIVTEFQGKKLFASTPSSGFDTAGYSDHLPLIFTLHLPTV